MRCAPIGFANFGFGDNMTSKRYAMMVCAAGFILLSQTVRGDDLHTPAAAAATGQSPFKLVEAPPLGRCTIGTTTDLGGWHDVFVLEESDSLILRRGAEVFMLGMGDAAKPQKMANLPDMGGTQIAYAGHSAKKVWLFCTSKNSLPFAVDLSSGKKVEFVIPGLKVPGDQSPVIQSCVMAENVGGAVLMISGGDKATWPRDGNRPIYFWFDLKSGRVVQMPVGYDLEFLSGDQAIAVFEKQSEKFKRRGKAALDVGTGQEMERVFDRREKAWVPFNWSDTHRVKPLMAPEGPHPDGESRDCDIIGISMAGKLFPFSSPIKKRQDLLSPECVDGWVGFQLCKSGTPDIPALFCGPLNKEIRLEQVAERTLRFKLLSKGRCVYVEGEHGPKHDSCEALVCDPVSRTTWNVLDGVVRLPELDAALAAKPQVSDTMDVRLVASFGEGKRQRLVLCLFSHWRRSSSLSDGKFVPFQFWRRGVLVSGELVRGQVSIFEGRDRPDHIWLHNSGRLFFGTNGKSDDSGEISQINLHSMQISLEPAKNGK